MTTVIIIVLLLLACVGILGAVALGLSVRGRVMLLDAKVQVICDELGVTVPMSILEPQDDEGGSDASQIAR